MEKTNAGSATVRAAGKCRTARQNNKGRKNSTRYITYRRSPGGVSGDEGALPGVLSVGDPQEEVSGDDNSFSDAESERVRFNSSLSIYIFSFLYYQYLMIYYMLPIH